MVRAKTKAAIKQGIAKLKTFGIRSQNRKH